MYGYYGTFIWQFLGEQIPVLAMAVGIFMTQIYIVRFFFLLVCIRFVTLHSHTTDAPFTESRRH
jgi:hypothetical protein